jgi:hypothetical protein
VRAGFAADDSVVTVLAAEAPHNINDHGSESAEEIVLTVAGTIREVGGNNLLLGQLHLLVLGPEHARTFADDGWTVSRIQEEVFERSRIPVEWISSGNRIELKKWGRSAVNGHYSVGNSPADVGIVVAGGPGKHSMWIPTFAGSQHTSRLVGSLSA